MKIIIAGGGKVGFYLTRELSEKGHQVFLIERRPERAARIAESVPEAIVIHGDACDHEYLEQARIDEADIVIAVTGDDDDNLVISQLAKEVYGVGRVIARVNNPKNEKIFRLLNVDVPVAATSMIVKIVEEEAALDGLVTLLPLADSGEEEFRIVETSVKPESPVVGRKIEELGLPRDCVLVAIVREGKVVIPRGSTTLEAQDTVYALVSKKHESTLVDAMKGTLSKEACDL